MINTTKKTKSIKKIKKIKNTTKIIADLVAAAAENYDRLNRKIS